MKIYTIKHDLDIWDSFCDSFKGHTVVANSELEVRMLVRPIHKDEGEAIWGTAEIVEQGTYTGDKTDPFVLMSDLDV